MRSAAPIYCPAALSCALIAFHLLPSSFHRTYSGGFGGGCEQLCHCVVTCNVEVVVVYDKMDFLRHDIWTRTKIPLPLPLLLVYDFFIPVKIEEF